MKQQTIILPITEVEYIAVRDAAREATWSTVLKSELMPKCQEEIILYMDNQNTILIMKNPEQHQCVLFCPFKSPR